MLQIQKISKQYKTESLTQQALDKVSLNLRKCEFVAILGASGSGKTTLLNIIGGLDRYDSGDLIINGISTKNYSDRDWDSYRNHTIGFVFQSYNLIPHQTVLSNVELALTISGVSKAERKRRAKDALIEVGLADHMYKRPNQLSGGQMQRVAIARALVNNPDILLADEPTGALDSTTSLQVMDLLKEVAKDRLVVMVTHNPELAEEYATRIVKLKDGQIIDDSNPYVVEEITEATHKNMGKSSMSLLTAFSLSLNNLLTKKGRTILTAFAGSIGIIGIALILSLSTGFQNYIDKIQEDTLSSYPLTITQETADITSALLQMVADRQEATGKDTVTEMQSISTMFSKVGSNDLTSLKKHLEKDKATVDKYVSKIRYRYSISPMIYINNQYGITQVNPSKLLSALSGTSGMTSMMQSSSSSVFNEMLDDQATLDSQYEVLAGKWPTNYNEMIIVLNDPNTISDLLVYNLGLRDSKELESMLADIMAGNPVENNSKPLEFTYDELLNLEFKLINASDKYRYNDEYKIYEDMSEDKAFMKNVYENSEALKIVGVVCPKEGVTSQALYQGVAYTKDLTKYVIEKASESELVKKQLANKEIDIFSGKRFDDNSEETGLNFNDMISIDEEALKNAFGGNFDESLITNLTQNYMEEISNAINADTSEAKEALTTTMVTFIQDMLTKYIEENTIEVENNINVDDILMNLLSYIQTNFPQIQLDEEVLKGYIEDFKEKLPTGIVPEAAIIKKEDVNELVEKYLNTEFAQEKMQELTRTYVIPVEAFSEIFKGFLTGYFETLSQIMSLDGETITLTKELVEPTSKLYTAFLSLTGATDKVANMMGETVMQKTILSTVGKLMGELTSTIAKSMDVDPSAIASAFKFNLNEEELMRLMSTMTTKGMESNANTNLLLLGYQDIDSPSTISFYFKDFESKGYFVDYLKDYNDRMETEDENKVVRFTDLTGILMSSMTVIVDSVSYVLIAFVSISLVVSSIMIGIITYISVLERTKEIGILRAIGASKKNISSIFNAETFIIGLFSGVIGIGVTLALIPLINTIIHNVTGNMNVNAVLPPVSAIILIILSIILTLIGGLIPSKQAAMKDPVTALRTE